MENGLGKYTELGMGDTVEVKFTGVVEASGGGGIDVRLKSGLRMFGIPDGMAVLTKKAPPVEPRIGTVIEVRGFETYLWKREAKGWVQLKSGTDLYTHGYREWVDFGHENVYVHGSPTKLT